MNSSLKRKSKVLPKIVFLFLCLSLLKTVVPKAEKSFVQTKCLTLFGGICSKRVRSTTFITSKVWINTIVIRVFPLLYTKSNKRFQRFSQSVWKWSHEILSFTTTLLCSEESITSDNSLVYQKLSFLLNSFISKQSSKMNPIGGKSIRKLLSHLSKQLNWLKIVIKHYFNKLELSWCDQLVSK